MPSDRTSSESRSRLVSLGDRSRWGAFVLLLGGMAWVLHLMGRTWWCDAGDLDPWSGDIWSVHNSQHLLDPYTFTHVLHGIVLYGILWLTIRSITTPSMRGWIALAAEVAWELVENTDPMIERYREETLAIGYYGDSIVNSLADVVAFVVGYWAAGVLPVWASVCGFLLVDAALVLWIRDSLVLNVLMLVHPLERVKEWQMGGMP